MEDFVTYEITQKLKEKGYPIKRKRSGIFGLTKQEYIDEHPTIYQALKWLRDEKDIFIGLEYINQKKCGCNIIKQKTGGLIAKWNWDKFQYANKNPLVGISYEETALAGIKYVIDNLI
jgi:hypothetical protein